MRVLLQSVTKKTSLISMGLLLADSNLLIKNSLSSSGYSYLTGRANFDTKIGGHTGYPSDTTSRQTIINEASPCLLTYIVLPFFPRSINASQKYRLFVTIDGMEHVIDLINDTALGYGRLLGFGVPVQGVYSPLALESVAESYSGERGVLCSTSLKVEFQYMGLTRAESFVGNTNEERKISVGFVGLDSNLTMPISPVFSTPEFVSNLKDFN